MAIGSYMGRTFTVSDRKIFTPSNLKGQSGSEWATHDRTGAKPRSQWISPKLKSYTFDLLLRAQDGASPRSTLKHFQECAEKGVADYFIVGNAPISAYPFKITALSDEWDAVLHSGALVECKVSMTIEEYL